MINFYLHVDFISTFNLNSFINTKNISLYKHVEIQDKWHPLPSIV